MAALKMRAGGLDGGAGLERVPPHRDGLRGRRAEDAGRAGGGAAVRSNHGTVRNRIGDSGSITSLLRD